MSLKPIKKKEEVYESKVDVDTQKAIRAQYKLYALRQRRAMGNISEYESGLLAALEAKEGTNSES